MAFLTDSSTNNFELTAFGNAQLNTTTFKYGGGSGSFNGTGDYIQVPENNNFEFGSEDFTIESWIYPTNISPPKAVVSKGAPGTTTDNVWTLEWTGTALRFYGAPGLGPIVTTTTSFTTNTWYHVALTRSSNVYRIFVNGVLEDTNSSNNSTIQTGGPVIVGAGWFDPANRSFNGYIDDVRITKGIARYTSNFTPPQQQLSDPSDQYVSNVSLLLHMDGLSGSQTFTDSSTNNFTLTAFGNAQIDTSVKKFGSGAAYFSTNNTDYIVALQSNGYAFGTADFTVEMWLYPTQMDNAYHVFFDTRPQSGSIGGAVTMFLKADQTLHLLIGGESDIVTSALTPNQWTHVALVRTGNDFKIYLNGTQSGSTFTSSVTIDKPYLIIGKTVESPANYYYGYIDELRITKGVARYTSNFVPQTAPFANPVPAIPTDGLLVRFNADNGIGESGGSITSWTDQQNGVVATGFNSPTLLTNQLNGRNAVSFDGTNSYFTFTFPTPIGNGTPRTFVIIGRYNNPTTTAQKGYLNSTSGDLCYVFKNVNEDRSYFYTENKQIFGPTAASSSSLANYHIQTIVHNGIPNSNFIRINGVTSYGVSYGTMNNLPQLTNIVIGGRGTPGEIISGQIVEILIYNKELTSQEIQQIENYANI